MVGLAADDDAEAGDAADLGPPLFGVVAADAVDDRVGGEGELVGAGDRVVVTLPIGTPAIWKPWSAPSSRRGARSS